MPQELHRVSCDASGAAFASGAEMRPTKAIFVRKPGSLLRVAPSRRPSSTSSSSTAVIPALTAAAELFSCRRRPPVVQSVQPSLIFLILTVVVLIPLGLEE